METFDFPEIFGDETLDCFVALDDEAQRRKLAASITDQLLFQGSKLVLKIIK
jgi:hypothetical protein